MKVTIELTDSLLEAIAEQEALEHAYDTAVESNDSADIFYARAFYDGATFVLNQLKNQENDTSNS